MILNCIIADEMETLIAENRGLKLQIKRLAADDRALP